MVISNKGLARLRFLRDFTYVFHRVRADRRSSRKQYHAAMDDVRRCYALLRMPVGHPEAPIDLTLKAGYLALRTEQYELAVWCTIHVVSDLRQGRGAYTRAERAHLDHYAKQIGSRAAYLGATPVPWPAPPARPHRPPGKIGLDLQQGYPVNYEPGNDGARP